MTDVQQKLIIKNYLQQNDIRHRMDWPGPRIGFENDILVPPAGGSGKILKTRILVFRRGFLGLENAILECKECLFLYIEERLRFFLVIVMVCARI